MDKRVDDMGEFMNDDGNNEKMEQIVQFLIDYDGVCLATASAIRP